MDHADWAQWREERKERRLQANIIVWTALATIVFAGWLVHKEEYAWAVSVGLFALLLMAALVAQAVENAAKDIITRLQR